jgi:hypothetical protein
MLRGFWLKNLKEIDYLGGIPWHSWEDNIKMDLKKLNVKFMDWIYFVYNVEQWHLFQNIVINL